MAQVVLRMRIDVIQKTRKQVGIDRILKTIIEKLLRMGDFVFAKLYEHLSNSN